MSIPVLMYHHILPKDSFIASSVENFDKQMRFLSNNGWTTITSEQFYQYKKGEISLPKKSVFITFDDGWRDNYIYAYPILKKYNLKATLFVVTQWIEKSSLMHDCEYIMHKHNRCKLLVSTDARSVICTWNELKQMGDVFDIHAHTYTHRDEYFQKVIPWENEFLLSQKLIKDNLGFVDNHLCWPRGIYTKALVKEAIKQGFDMLYTTKRGINRPDGNLQEIKRLAVKKEFIYIFK